MNPATEIDGELYVDGALSSYLPMRAFESVDDKRTVIGLMIADSAKRLTSPETFEEYSGSLADMILRKMCSEESTWSGDRTVAFGKNKLADIGLFASPNEVQADSMFEDGLSCMQEFVSNEMKGASAL
jgi:predicted acylesterase/phospholipase RssA